MRSRGASWTRPFVQQTRVSKREAFESWCLTSPRFPGAGPSYPVGNLVSVQPRRAGRRRHPAPPDSGAMRQIEREVRTRLLASLGSKRINPCLRQHDPRNRSHSPSGGKSLRQESTGPSGRMEFDRSVDARGEEVADGIRRDPHTGVSGSRMAAIGCRRALPRPRRHRGHRPASARCLHQPRQRLW